MFELQQEGAEQERIRALFSEMGGALPVREVAQHCIEAGVWDETQLQGMMVNGAVKRVKDALRSELNGSGLPFAAAIGKGHQAVWKQRDLFQYEDYVSVLDMGVAAVVADHSRLRAWQLECRAKFGVAPSIPDLI